MMTPDEQPANTPDPEEAPVSDTSAVPPPPPINPPPVMPSAKPTSGRPVAATVIGILFLLTSVYSVFSFIFPTPHNLYYDLSKIINAIFLAVKVAVGIGLLTTAWWARAWAIYTLVAQFVTGVGFAVFFFVSPGLALASMPSGSTGSIPILPIMIVSMVIGLVFSAGLYGVAIYFLTRPNMKEAFARR